MAIPQQGVPAKPAQGAAVNAKMDVAKNALAGAKKFTSQVDAVAPPAAKPQPSANPVKAVQRPPQVGGLGQEATSAGAGIAARIANEKQLHDADAAADRLPKMHAGGTVPEDGDYNLQKGEHVTAAPAPVGRQSEYRKVYLQRKSGAPAEQKAAPAIDKAPPAASKKEPVTAMEKVQDSKGE